MSKARGKIIDKWVLDIKGTKVTVPVKMVAGPPTTFNIDYKYGEFRYQNANADIDALKSDLRVWLKDMLTFSFKSYFYVSFKGMTFVPTKVGDAGEVATELEWRAYDIGTTSIGVEMYRDNTKMMNAGSWVEGRPELGNVVDHHNRHALDALCALVPATPENEAALVLLSKAFDDLHTKLRTFLAPGLIEEGFARMVSGELNLLRGPDAS